jgi:hypothetical protein
MAIEHRAKSLDVCGKQLRALYLAGFLPFGHENPFQSIDQLQTPGILPGLAATQGCYRGAKIDWPNNSDRAPNPDGSDPVRLLEHPGNTIETGLRIGCERYVAFQQLTDLDGLFSHIVEEPVGKQSLPRKNLISPHRRERFGAFGLERVSSSRTEDIASRNLICVIARHFQGRE